MTPCACNVQAAENFELGLAKVGNLKESLAAFKYVPSEKNLTKINKEVGCSTQVVFSA